MAKLHNFSVQESLNTSTSGGWTVSTSGTAGSNALDTNTIHFNVSGATNILGIYADVNIHFKFTTADSDIVVADDDDMILLANTLTFINVPRGLGNTIIFNYISTTTTTGSVRIVEI